ncbi:MAG: hypothetical protein MI924_08805 [Chloroflexales bacterium]|nr:hypothetical protein [Chloroflexales bacterium]
MRRNETTNPKRDQGRTARQNQRELLGQLRSAHAAVHDLSWALAELESHLQTLIDHGSEGPTDIMLEREIRDLQRQRDELESQLIVQMIQTDDLTAQLERERQKAPE